MCIYTYKTIYVCIIMCIYTYITIYVCIDIGLLTFDIGHHRSHQILASLDGFPFASRCILLEGWALERRDGHVGPKELRLESPKHSI